MSPLSEMPGALTDRRDTGAVLELHRTWWSLSGKH